MIDNITVDTGKGISTIHLGDKIVITDNRNNKTYEEVTFIQVYEEQGYCLVEAEKTRRYYDKNRIISYEQKKQHWQK